MRRVCSLWNILRSFCQFLQVIVGVLLHFGYNILNSWRCIIWVNATFVKLTIRIYIYIHIRTNIYISELYTSVCLAVRWTSEYRIHSQACFSFVLACGLRVMEAPGAPRIRSQRNRRNGWRLTCTLSTSSRRQRHRAGSGMVRVLNLPRRTY